MGQWIPKGEWKYDTKIRQVRSTKVYKCVATDGKSLFLEKCDESSASQKWTWAEMYLV
jgi:hypothetical protein